MSLQPTREGLRAEAPLARHMLQRTVILPELRVLFVPVPKAACTTILWLLADLAGLPPERFARSPSAEVSPSLTVHDTNLWPAENRLASYGEEARDELLSEPDWLRFSVVRHPATRLWSAWVSKLLLREPRFVEEFGEEPWFPLIPETAEEVVSEFRRFVAAVGEGRASDVHWALQHDLVNQVELTHLGRVERIDETLALLRGHVGDARWPGRRRDHNRSPLSLPEHAYDSAAAEVLAAQYATDYAEFGYDELIHATATVPAAAWKEQVGSQLPTLEATIEERSRLGQLHRMARRRQERLEAAEQKLDLASARRIGHSRLPAIRNLEGHHDFDVRWAWAEGPLDPGFTAVLRVKNEGRTLPFSLPPLLRSVGRVVLVDNGSTDGTATVAQRVAAEHGLCERLDVFDYPFAIARCGVEHLATPSASVHSLVHFYNWSFSHVRTGYALKWDGDMVMTDGLTAVLRELAWQLQAAEVVIKIPRRPLYVLDDRRAYIDLELRNCEPWGWPNRPGYSFAKALEWELPLWGGETEPLELPDWGCVELKLLDEDEFAHWSEANFADSPRQHRKRREWEVYSALAAGRGAAVGVEAIHAPAGVHVVDYVRDTWMPQRAAGEASGRETALVAA